MSSPVRKARCLAALRLALLDMLEVMREEGGSHIDGVAADLTFHDTGECSGNLAALVGDIEVMGEVL